MLQGGRGRREYRTHGTRFLLTLFWGMENQKEAMVTFVSSLRFITDSLTPNGTVLGVKSLVSNHEWNSCFYIKEALPRL